MATQTYMGIPNDPRLNEDEPTKAMLNGATQAAYESGIPLSPTLTQRASDIARAEEANAINHEITSRYANAAIMAPIIQNAMTQAQQQPQQPQIEQQAPVLTQGLLPSLMENNAYQGREMSGAEMAPQEPQTLTQMARKYGQDILDAKQLYAQGEAMGGDQGAQVMALAHSGAERARAGLQQLGVDPAQYGLNGTYDEAVQALANNDTRAMQNILQGEMAESSGQYYDRIYKILRDQGFSRDIAESEAHRRAQSYASQRVQALNQAFNTYGHNGQVINPMGIQMLGMMAQEDTDMANYYTQRYAGPLQEYAANRQERNMAIQQANKEKNAAVQFNRELKKMGVQAQYKALLQQNEAAQKEAQAQRDYGRKVALEVEKARIKVQYGLVKGKGKSGRSSGSSDDGGFKPTEALSVIEKYNKWNSDHEGEEWQNPLTDAYDEALATLNRQSPAPHDVNNADSVYSWAQSVLEYNARNGYPATPEGLYQAIAAVGGYGPAVAEDLKNDPNKPLEKYGRTN